MSSLAWTEVLDEGRKLSAGLKRPSSGPFSGVGLQEPGP